MSELEEIREELASIYHEIRGAENRLSVLHEKGANIIKEIESEKNKIKELYKTAGRLEDKICRLSS